MFSVYFRVFHSILNLERAWAHKKILYFRTSSEHKRTLFRAGTSEHRAVRSSTQHKSIFCLQIVSELETLNNTPRMLLCVAGKHLVTWPNTWINSETHCTIVIISNSLGGALLYSYNHNWSHRETDHFGSCFCRSFDIIFCWFVLTWQKQPIYRQNFALKLAHCFWKCKIGHFEIKMHSCIINMS